MAPNETTGLLIQCTFAVVAAGRGDTDSLGVEYSPLECHRSPARRSKPGG
jgi:hypothetical protein